MKAVSTDTLAAGSASLIHIRSSRRRSALRLAVFATPVLALTGLPASPARAVDLFFDGDGQGTIDSGSGQWDSSLLRWSASPGGGSHTTWSDGNDAVFNLGGTIEVTGVVNPNAMRFSGGSTFLRNGLLGTLTLGGPAIDVASGNVHFLSAVGGGGLTKTGAGAISFYGGSASTPGGAWDIQQGSVVVRTNATGFTGKSLNIGAGATLDLGHAGVNSNALSGSGNLVLGSNIQIGTITGARIGVNNDGSDSTFNGVISGVGRFEKRGAGTLTLGGINTFSGHTTVTGTLVVTSGNALSDVDPTFVQGTSTLQLNANEAIGSLGGNSATNGGTVNLNGNTLTIGGDNINNQFAGVMSGGGLVRKVGTGVQILGSNSGAGSTGYTGKWEIAGGTLAFAPSTGQTDFFFGADPGVFVADHITLSGGTLAGALSVGGAATYQVGANRGITVTADSGLAGHSSNSTSQFTLNGRVTGSNQLTVRGYSITNLNAENGGSYSGKLNVVDGTLGTTAADTVVQPFGSGSIDISGALIKIAPTGVGTPSMSIAPGASTLTYGPGSNLWVLKGGNTNATVTVGNLARGGSGSLVIHADSGTANLGTAAGESVKVTGGVTNVNGMVPGIFAAANSASTDADFVEYDNTVGFKVATYSAATDINVSTNTTVFSATGATTNTLSGPGAAYALRVTGTNVDLAGQTLTLGNGTDPGMVALNGGGAVNNGTLNFGGRDALIYAADLAGTNSAAISNAANLVKTGLGQLQLSTPASYTGDTYINSGSLIIGANEVLPAGTDVILSGAGGMANTPTFTGVTVFSYGALSVNGFTQTINSLTGSTNSHIDFGLDGVLKIAGNANTTFLGGGTTTAGSTASTLWNAGGGRLQMGIVQPPSSGGVGIQGKSMGYNKLWITNGSTVALGTGAYIPNSPSTLTADTYMLDNGTLEVNSANIGGVSISNGGASTFSLSTGNSNASNKGILIGPGGGTIRVVNPLEIVTIQRGNNLTDGTDDRNIITGTGTLSKDGPGVLRLGIGNRFEGKWQLKQGVVQFQTDANGVAGGSPHSALGAAPASYVADGIIFDGGVLQSNGDGVIHANRGVTITANGGALNASTGDMVFNSKIVGPGTLTLAGQSTSRNVSFNAANNTFGNLVIKTGYANFNANESAGSGTITLDPSMESIGIGKDEGPDSTISNPIFMGGNGLIDIRVASDASPVQGSILNGTIGSLTLAGKISGPGDFFKGHSPTYTYFFFIPTTQSVSRILDGTVILSNSTNDFTGNVTISGGSLVVAANNALGSTAGSTIVNNLGSLGIQGGINYTAGETVYLSGTGGGAGAALRNISDVNTFAGSIVLTSDATIDVTAGALKTGSIRGASTLTKTGGDLEVQHIRTNGLNLSGGNIRVTPNSLGAGVSNIRTLNLGGNKLDLTDNKLVTADPAGTWDGASAYTGVSGLVDTARGSAGNAMWDGPSGITTSDTRAINNGDLISIGVAQVSEVRSVADTATTIFAGQTVLGSDTLAMVTWGGDANLDGKINIDDYGRIDGNVGQSGSVFGWSKGDFNYDGKINIDDYGIIDGNINRQGAAFVTSGDAGSVGLEGVSAVPEPASLSLVVVGAGALMRRRRNR